MVVFRSIDVFRVRDISVWYNRRVGESGVRYLRRGGWE